MIHHQETSSAYQSFTHERESGLRPICVCDAAVDESVASWLTREHSLAMSAINFLGAIGHISDIRSIRPKGWTERRCTTDGDGQRGR